MYFQSWDLSVNLVLTKVGVLTMFQFEIQGFEKALTVIFFPGRAEITLSLLLQIVAVILSTTGIALLAYADGIATTKTLAGVVLAAASAAGSAVYNVFFKRVFGEVSFCQVAIFFSSIGLCSLLTLWTIFLALHLTGQGNFC